MRIALVHSFYSSDQPSGENDVVLSQRELLQAAGHDVRLISVHTDQIQHRRAYPVRAAINVAVGTGVDPEAEIAEFAPDVIHVHNLFPNIGQGWLARVKAPIVATFHNFRPLCAAGSFFRDGTTCHRCPTTTSAAAVIHGCYRGSRFASLPLAIATRASGSHNALLSRVDRAIFLSDRAAETYRVMAGIELSHKAVVVPNFLQLPDVKPESIALDSWIYVGRLAAEKGIVELIRSWPASIPLRILGGGPEETRSRTAAEGKRIEFLGVVPQRDVHAFVANATGLIFPSLWEEPAPAMAYLHALAAGIPTFALRGNAVSDDIERFGTGLVFDDVESLVDVARSGCSFADQASSASRHFREAFSAEAWLEAMEKVYEEVAVHGTR